MELEIILLAILFNYLRKHLQKTGLLPQWKKIFTIGLVLSIGLIVISVTQSGTRTISIWIAHVLIVALLFLMLDKSELQPVRYVVYITLPFVAINIIYDLVKLFSESFAERFDNYFQVGILFAVIWMITMLVITNKQKKTLEKEHLKAAEREKEFKITESLKQELEIQVAERTAALTLQKTQLENTILDLKETQAQLIQSEKMASLGELTAGIAHEIQNPLNFINNFSEINKELLEELKDEIDKGNMEDVKALANDVIDNQEKINHHGKRADAIVKGMLQHSRSSSSVKEPTDINKLTDEYLRLAYHGLRAKDKSFNATLKTDYDNSIGNINIVPQDIGRAILNIINNAFYAAILPLKEKFSEPKNKHEPTVCVSTKKLDDKILISVSDNGPGIPQNIIDKIFQPFFTPKPAREGTGLGLSLSYDIVKAHGGEIKVESKESEGSEFVILLPIH